MKALHLVSILFILLLIPSRLVAQGESALPFLLISPSPSANGMGNINTAVVSTNPITTIMNPAQLGMFSLGNYFAASTYSNKTAWLPRFGISDLTYDAWAINAGYNVSELLDLPLPIGIGLGYSRVNLNLGTFVSVDPNGVVIGSFNSSEKSTQFSVSLGAEYFVRASIGWNFKTIASTLFQPGQGPPGRIIRAEPTATDFGLLLQVPVFDILTKAGIEDITLAQSIEPVADLTFGYTRNNLSSKPIAYAGVSQTDPMPRSTTVGISAELGFKVKTESTDLRLLTFTLAREAEDLLVFRNQDGTFEYQSGLGDISFFKHVLGGKLSNNDRPKLHKGWQLNFGEMVYLRGGSFSESVNFGARNFTTSGFGIRLSGLLRIMEAMSPALTEESVFSFIAHHVDVGYDHAEYMNHDLLGGATFKSITFIIR